MKTQEEQSEIQQTRLQDYIQELSTKCVSMVICIYLVYRDDTGFSAGITPYSVWEGQVSLSLFVPKDVTLHLQVCFLCSRGGAGWAWFRIK